MEASYGNQLFVDFINEKKRLFKQADLLLNRDYKQLLYHGLKPDHAILDIGCGQGILTNYLSFLNPSARVIGVDPDTTLLQQARALCPSNSSFVEGSVYDLPYTESFDFAYSRLLFQHLSDPGAALQQVYQSLRKGGRFCIIDIDDDWLFMHPGIDSLNTLVQLGIQGQRSRSGDRQIGKKLFSLLEQNGFHSLRLNVELLTSSEIGMNSFLDLCIGFRANFQYTDVNVYEIYEEVKAAINATPATYFGGIAIFYVSGQK